MLAAVAAAFLVTALALVGGRALLGEEEPAPTAEPLPASATPLADYDRDGLRLVRAAFCGRISPEAAALGLGADDADEVEAPVAWRPGARLPGSSALANEWGCAFTSGTTTASAWLFATPVTPRQARGLARTAGRGDCTVKDVPEIGSPGVVVTCGDGARKHTTYHGLVGDTWLACRMSGTGDAERVGRWCVVALEAMRG